ncbi:MAG: hypothetical protein WBZ24_14785 [Anaerolineales bacterium]|jgi:hypothetical protein
MTQFDNTTEPINVLSVDLASRRYRDFGFAYLRLGSRAPLFPKPDELGLQDPPDPTSFADALEAFCRNHEVGALLLDGPQAWRYPGSQIEHMRLCERALNTPGKTGVPGHVKPAPMLKYVLFSIDVFRHLHDQYGWSFLTHDWSTQPHQRWVVEVFPSSAWSTLGWQRLPSRPRSAAKIEPWRRMLAKGLGLDLPDHLTHDEIQASVVLPLGEAIVNKDKQRIVLAGVDPIWENGNVYEGLIANPVRA